MLSVAALYLNLPTPSTPSLLVIRWLLVLLLLLGMLCQGSNRLRTRKSSLNELLCLNTSNHEEDHRYVSSRKWTAYHITMAVVCLGIPTALSHNDPPISKLLYTLGHYGWWGCTLGAYLWSLLASKAFPQRDFSDLENYFREYELD